MTSVDVACPDCPEVITVPIETSLIRDDGGRQRLVCDPDLTDLWAHSWTHADEADSFKRLS